MLGRFFPIYKLKTLWNVMITSLTCGCVLQILSLSAAFFDAICAVHSSVLAMGWWGHPTTNSMCFNSWSSKTHGHTDQNHNLVSEHPNSFEKENALFTQSVWKHLVEASTPAVVPFGNPTELCTSASFARPSQLLGTTLCLGSSMDGPFEHIYVDICL